MSVHWCFSCLHNHSLQWFNLVLIPYLREMLSSTKASALMITWTELCQTRSLNVDQSSSPFTGVKAVELTMCHGPQRNTQWDQIRIWKRDVFLPVCVHCESLHQNSGQEQEKHVYLDAMYDENPTLHNKNIWNDLGPNRASESQNSQGMLMSRI